MPVKSQNKLKLNPQSEPPGVIKKNTNQMPVKSQNKLKLNPQPAPPGMGSKKKLLSTGVIYPFSQTDLLVCKKGALWPDYPSCPGRLNLIFVVGGYNESIFDKLLLTPVVKCIPTLLKKPMIKFVSCKPVKLYLQINNALVRWIIWLSPVILCIYTFTLLSTEFIEQTINSFLQLNAEQKKQT